MDSQFLYQDDLLILEFDASVVEILALPDGRKGAVLDRTYFYPTGGGQEHDTGKIGSANVVDVFKDDENPRLVHVVEGEVALGMVKASIDARAPLASHAAPHRPAPAHPVPAAPDRL